ncbi:uncharacterized protein LOC126377493 [Pectinophora gossypiella]|uniref:uncharacterized protein LOC126377493 n=1 Tax=Pectinophora gossypiella TaxID=13191 RepID=UPI00214E7531|nr:uncharacterized protein LOC126377493 [Pectinophora gossypiella]
MKYITLSSLVVFLLNEAIALNLPGPLVYVVTPSSRRIDEGRSAPQPFYYHNWMRRMDSPPNTTTTTTTTTPRPKTPDLIFAEFEADKMKNIRKLLERERIATKTTSTTTTTTSKPIYVPDESVEEAQKVNYGLPLSEKNEVQTKEKDMTDYFALYNNLYNGDSAPLAPVYLPSTTPSSPRTTITSTLRTTTPITTTSTQVPAHNVENIWQIIDSQRHDQYSGQWDEVPIGAESDDDSNQNTGKQEDDKSNMGHEEEEDGKIDENFALPGFGTNPGNGAENESRAIRTEPNMRFPYVNLKNLKKPLLNVFSNSKKGNNMYTSLDNFVDIKHPVRGEVQDPVPVRQPIDRYNPAQPYLPGVYGTKSKQSSPSVAPVKTVANLVPPPLPPPPKLTDNDFPAPATYEQYPPFASSGPDAGPPAPPPLAPQPPMMPQPPMESLDDSYSSPGDDSGPTMELGYRYKPPSPPTQNFLPTLPPLQKPFGGYSYDKPPMTAEAPPMEMDGKPDFQGYNYDKPAPAVPDQPDFHGYHYSKPAAPPKEAPSYGHGPSPHHDSDYPELIYDKPHGGMDDTKGGDDMKADDMGMVPPPMPDMKPGDAHGPPMDDSGFPQDFPGDFKYHHDFDDHDFYHHHHHHTTTTTTTTTEMPRVNRYSYYYLGKKLYYLPLYFSVYFIIYVGALIIKAVLRHKIVYPNSWRPNDDTASFFSKRSVDSWNMSNENLHEITGRVTHAIATAAERYIANKKDD